MNLVYHQRIQVKLEQVMKRLDEAEVLSPAKCISYKLEIEIPGFFELMKVNPVTDQASPASPHIFSGKGRAAQKEISMVFASNNVSFF
jgi:hypothetical protein